MVIDTDSWKFWTILLVVIIFFMWIFLGGDRNQEIIGLEPLLKPCKNTPEKLESYKFEKRDRKFGSVGEELCCKIFEEYLGREVKINIRPDHLKNPETGRNLEYDMYDPITNIAIEYNGEQHYTYPCKYHKSETDFKNQIYRDTVKQILSDKNNIKLIIVPYTIDTCDVDETQINGYKKNLSLSRQDREDRIRKYLVPILEQLLNPSFQV